MIEMGRRATGCKSEDLPSLNCHGSFRDKSKSEAKESFSFVSLYFYLFWPIWYMIREKSFNEKGIEKKCIFNFIGIPKGFLFGTKHIFRYY